MQLVERYLQAVKFWLPKKQQDDIIAELSEDLHAQIDEREAELGRSLNEVETEDLLRRRGSPMRVANGYLPQRSLIGPAVFPVYAFVLKIVTVVSLVLCVAGAVGQCIGHVARTAWPHLFAGTVRPLWTGWLSSAAITTLVFATFERTSIAARIFARWDPRKLPPLRSSNVIPRSSSVAGIIGLLSLLAWWVAKMAPPLTIHLGQFRAQMAPGWSLVFWAVLCSSFGSLILEVTNLLRPCWTVSRATARLVLRVAGTVVFCWFLQARLIASFSWPAATPNQESYATAQFNLWLAHFFPWAVAIGLMAVAFEIWRLLKIRRPEPGRRSSPLESPS